MVDLKIFFRINNIYSNKKVIILCIVLLYYVVWYCG